VTVLDTSLLLPTPTNHNVICKDKRPELFGRHKPGPQHHGNAGHWHTDIMHRHKENWFVMKYINLTENMYSDILPFIICSTCSKQKEYTTGETDHTFTTAAKSGENR